MDKALDSNIGVSEESGQWRYHSGTPSSELYLNRDAALDALGESLDEDGLLATWFDGEDLGSALDVAPDSGTQQGARPVSSGVTEVSQAPASSAPELTAYLNQVGQECRLTISAECHSDDHRAEVDFDATRWFVQASDKEILALAACGWGRDEAADEVAQYMQSHDEEVRCMFAYLEGANRVRGIYEDMIGFEVSVVEDDALKYCRAFRYPLFVKLMLLREFGGLQEAIDAGYGVQEQPSQAGAWHYRVNGHVSEESFPSADEAYRVMGLRVLEARWEASHEVDAAVLDIVPGCGTQLQATEPPRHKPVELQSKVSGRADEATGGVLVMNPQAVPLTGAELQRITNDGEFYVQVAVPVDLSDLIDGDIETLNDTVSEAITGSCCGLTDLSFKRYIPDNEKALIGEADKVYVLVTAGWESSSDSSEGEHPDADN
jgi:hypothetical protein